MRPRSSSGRQANEMTARRSVSAMISVPKLPMLARTYRDVTASGRVGPVSFRATISRNRCTQSAGRKASGSSRRKRSKRHCRSIRSTGAPASVNASKMGETQAAWMTWKSFIAGYNDFRACQASYFTDVDLTNAVDENGKIGANWQRSCRLCMDKMGLRCAMGQSQAQCGTFVRP